MYRWLKQVCSWKRSTRRHRLRRLVPGLALVSAIVGMNGVAHAQAIVTNGTVRIGVEELSDLNVAGGPPSVIGQTIVGLRLIKPGVGELEYTSDGCTCEGWGVADAGSGVTGFADSATGTSGLAPVGFSSTATDATSIVETTDPGPVKIRVTHFFHPSITPNLYQSDVKIENIGTAAISDLRYRRTMDWDVEPTPFNEFVTIQGWPATALLFSSNNGFASGNPLVPAGSLFGPINANFTHLGPSDHGANFDFSFGALAVGKSKSFRIFYGAADSVTDADAAIATVGAEVYSYGEPNLPTTHLQYSVAIFAFKGVSNSPIADPGAKQTVECQGAPTPVVLDGSASSDPNESPLTFDWHEGTTPLGTGPTPTVLLSPGTHTITLTVTNSLGLTDSADVVIFVVDRMPPEIHCPPNMEVANDSGQCSASLYCGAPTATDLCEGPITPAGTRSDGMLLSDPYPVGTTMILWTAADDSGNSASCTQTVTVKDTEAPVITGAAVDRTELWPPNHKMVPVAVGYQVADNCDPGAAIVCKLSVSSNEPINGTGDGDTAPDWIVVDAHHLQLRAERAGTGTGRIYTITITCTDSKDNTSTKTVTVKVPKSQGRP
jgi:hypothetical protein